MCNYIPLLPPSLAPVVAPTSQPEPGPHPSVPEDNDVIITSLAKGVEGGCAEKPVVIVNDEEQEEEERQGVQGEDLEIIGAFSGMFSNTNLFSTIVTHFVRLVGEIKMFGFKLSLLYKLSHPHTMLSQNTQQGSVLNFANKNIYLELKGSFKGVPFCAVPVLMEKSHVQKTT